MKCLYCQSETTNPKYCSRSCSAKSTNSTSPKQQARSPRRFCKTCGNKTPIGRTYCSELCKTNTPFRTRKSRYTQLSGTLSDNSLKNGDANKFVRVRRDARYVYSISNEPMSCSVCGYDNHVEVCHIRSVSSFDDAESIMNINSMDNLIALCPNCHWELDHGMLLIIRE